MTRWLAGGVVLVLAGSAWAGDPCRSALKRLSKAPVATLTVQSERLGYTQVSYSPEASADKSTWLQLNHFTGTEGGAWDGVDEFTCTDGVLYLHSFTRRTAVGDQEDYNPPLPWLRLKLTEGDTWDWSGVLTVGPPGSDLRLVADAHFEVGAAEELKVPAGEYTAVPVAFALKVGGTEVITTSWVTPSVPYTVIQRTRTFYDAEGAEARTDRWELESLKE